MSSDLGFPINPSAAGTAVQFASDTEEGTGRRVPHNAVAHYNFFESAGNSSVANLAGNASFSGAIESTARHIATQVAVFCDRAVRIEVIQYSDAAGTRETARATFFRNANQGFCESINLNDWYYQVKVTNREATSSTIFSCQTSQGPIPAGPKSVGPYGGVPVEVVGRGEESKHYFAGLLIAPTLLTTGSNFLTLRNPSTTLSIKIQKLELLAYFTGTAAATRSAYAIRRQSGVTATGAGTAVVPAKGNPASAASIAELKFNLAATIALTGGSAPATNENVVHFGHANQLTANIAYDRDFSEAPIILAPNDTLFLQADGAIVAGSTVHVGLRWIEE